MDARETRLAYAAWAAVCIFWGTTYLAMRVGIETLPLTLFGATRFLTAGLILVVFLRLRGFSWPQGREWIHLTIVGLLLLGAGNWLVIFAQQWVPSGMAALMIAMTPFWMSGFEALTPAGDRITFRAVLGMMLGLAGLALLIGPRFQGTRLAPEMLMGVVALQGAAASWSAGSVYSRRFPVTVKPLMGAAIQMLIAGAVLLSIGTISGEWARFSFNPRTLAAFLWLVVFGSIVSYGCYLYALQKLPISTVSLYSYINPVIAVLLGWLLLGEPLTWREVTAMVIILSGVGIVRAAPVQRGKASRT